MRASTGPLASRPGGPAFIQSLRRGHYELGMDAHPGLILAGGVRRSCAGGL